MYYRMALNKILTNLQTLSCILSMLLHSLSDFCILFSLELLDYLRLVKVK